MGLGDVHTMMCIILCKESGNHILLLATHDAILLMLLPNHMITMQSLCAKPSYIIHGHGCNRMGLICLGFMSVCQV